jgi:hypothetical protein
MKESLVQQCLDILKREDIKRELKLLSNSVMEFIVFEIKPYIYLAVLFILSIFIMNLTILIILSFILTNRQTIIHKII